MVTIYNIRKKIQEKKFYKFGKQIVINFLKEGYFTVIKLTDSLICVKIMFMHVYNQTLAPDFPLKTFKCNQILNILIFGGKKDTSSALENFLKSNMKFGSVRYGKEHNHTY